MSIEDQLKCEILSRYKSIRAFTVENNIPYTTVDSIFKRGIMTAGIGTTLNIFGALDLDIESIKTGTLAHKTISNEEKSPALKAGDEELLKKYHQLNQYNRGRVSGYIDMLLEEAKSQEDSGSAAC